MSRGENAQADRRCHRVVQRPKGVRRNTSEQCPSLRAAKPPGKGGCGQHGGRAKPGQRQRMMRHPQQRTHDVLGTAHRNWPTSCRTACATGHRRRPTRRRWPRPSGTARPRCPRRAGGRSRFPGAARTSRNDRGPSPARNCEPTAIGWIAEQWSCSRPGMIASLVRVPPPISSAASRTVTWRPALARATAAARPFGPAPTTIAVAHASPPARSGPRSFLAAILTRARLRGAHASAP